MSPDNSKGSARRRIKEFLEQNVGRTVDKSEIAAVAGIDSWARRLRELRDQEGMPISSHFDRKDLRPGQYVLESLQVKERSVQPPVPRNIRLLVIERDGFACRACGRGNFDEDPSNLGRPLALYIERVDRSGPILPGNLRVTCSACSEEHHEKLRKRVDLLAQVRRASRAEQLVVLEWLRRKFETR